MSKIKVVQLIWSPFDNTGKSTPHLIDTKGRVWLCVEKPMGTFYWDILQLPDEPKPTNSPT